MHLPPPEHWPPQKVAIGAAELLEEKMRVLTLTELMRLTRMELCDLFTSITAALPEFPDGSAERANALMNLGNIRRVLARRELSPG